MWFFLCYISGSQRNILSIQFYGDKQTMKKRLKNISSASEKKNGADILIYAIIFTFSVGILPGCSSAKDYTEDTHGQFRVETPEIKDNLLENTQMDELLPESDSNSPETWQLSGDYSMSIGDLTISLYESKQDITNKLNENSQNYNEYDSDMKYSDSDYNKYDSYYMVGESPLCMDASQWVDACLCVYFKDGICVCLESNNEIPGTALGIHEDDSYSQLIEQYEDSFEKHTYNAHGVYNVYLYSYKDYICEFCIVKACPDSIYGIDIYVPGLYPVYDYGEEIID